MAGSGVRLIPTAPGPVAVGLQPDTVAAADVNGDGRPDLVATDGSGTVSRVRTTSRVPAALDVASMSGAGGAAGRIGVDAARPSFGSAIPRRCGRYVSPPAGRWPL